MKRIPKTSLTSDEKSTKLITPFFWKRCKRCNQDFKNEQGFKYTFKDSQGIKYTWYICGDCVSCIMPYAYSSSFNKRKSVATWFANERNPTSSEPASIQVLYDGIHTDSGILHGTLDVDTDSTLDTVTLTQEQLYKLHNEIKESEEKIEKSKSPKSKRPGNTLNFRT